MNIKMGNGSSILMSDKGESVKSIFQKDNDIVTKQAADIKMADFFKLPCQGLITGIDSRCCNTDNCDGVSEYDYVENAIDSYDANQALIAKQAEQIKVLLEEKRVRHDVLSDHVFISHDEFKELAAFAMCNDSTGQMANMDIVHSVLNQIATKCLGFDDWINAYHAIK